MKRLCVGRLIGKEIEHNGKTTIDLDSEDEDVHDTSSAIAPIDLVGDDKAEVEAAHRPPAAAPDAPPPDDSELGPNGLPYALCPPASLGPQRARDKRLFKPGPFFPQPYGAKAAQRPATSGWCYGAFEGYSEVRADGTLVQGWLKIPLGVDDDFDDVDEATVPVKEFDATAFLAYVAKAPSERADAQGPVPHTIDVGDYYMMAAEDRVLRVIGMLMAADDL
jgi:hypothetical protein